MSKNEELILLLTTLALQNGHPVNIHIKRRDN